MSFEKEWAQESENVIAAVQELTKVVAITLFSGVINASPVGNADLWVYNHPQLGYVDYLTYRDVPNGYVSGRFRSNWFMSKGLPSDKVTKATREKSKRLSEVRSIDDTAYSSNYFLSNNLPYAQRIESGWSTQAPMGVIAPQEARVNRLIPRLEAAVNKKYGV